MQSYPDLLPVLIKDLREKRPSEELALFLFQIVEKGTVDKSECSVREETNNEFRLVFDDARETGTTHFCESIGMNRVEDLCQDQSNSPAPVIKNNRDGFYPETAQCITDHTAYIDH